MLIGEPAPTQGDLHFRLFGFPVRVHPFFWFVSLFLGMGGFGEGQVDPIDTLIWVGVVFVSILVHELGHAFLQRYYGGRPWITLYSMGGLASCNDCDRSPRSQIIISLAGPVAGFLLATILVLLLWLSGHYIILVLMGNKFVFGPQGLAWEWLRPFTVFAAAFKPFSSAALTEVVYDLLYVNILWGLVNLLPIYPLDGGRISRELFTLGNPRQGIVQSLQLSIGTAALVAAYGFLQRDWYLGLMFGFLAYSSFQALQAYRGGWR